jgi:UDP-glucose 4-epimerase
MILEDRSDGLVINIGPEHGFVSINALATEIAEQLDFQLNPIYVPDRPQEVKVAYCSSQLAREILDYKEEISLKAGIESLIRYVKERGPRQFEYLLPLEIINEKTPITWKNKII